MSDVPEVIWSNTDYPYICLLDKQRTQAFQEAITEVVKPGDIVVEVGAGTGILSLFALAAGAEKVYAVEIDPILSEALKDTARLNGYTDKLIVVKGDAMTVDLPQNVNVVIGELVETGLLDEMQAVVMNSLRERGIIGSGTRVIPQSYDTNLELVNTSNDFYGFKIAAPKHDWPYYSKDPSSWEQVKIEAVSDVLQVDTYDFQSGLVDPIVDRYLDFEVREGQTANAIRLTGAAQLSDSVRLGACNTFSGDKVILLPEGEHQGPVRLHVTYALSTGMANLKVQVVNQPA